PCNRQRPGFVAGVRQGFPLLRTRHPSFDHLVGAREQRRWHCEAERLGGGHPPLLCYNKAHDLEHGFHTPALLGSHERASALRLETAHCRSLISHSRPAVSVSCASGLGGLCSWSKKYTPLTFAASGGVASHASVSAPFSGPRGTGLRIVIPKSISRPLLRLNPVATSPGWKQFCRHPGRIETSRQFSREQDIGELGHVRLKLRNVVTKYPFERLHRFPVIQPNSGHRDYSRSSCDGGRRSSGLVPGSQRAVLTRTLVAENVISTDKSALLWMYCREIARGKVED